MSIPQIGLLFTINWVYPFYAALVLNGHRIAVVMPAYNAEATLARTLSELDRGLVDEVVLVDDASTDETVALAGGSASSRSATSATSATGETRRPVTGVRSNSAPTSS